MKAIDYTNVVAATSSGVLYLLNSCATGTDFTERVGRKIIMKSLLLRIGVYWDQNQNDSNGDIIRFTVVQDTQANQTAPIVTDILSAAAVFRPTNLNNRQRFRILSDKFVSMGSVTAAAGELVNGGTTPRLHKLYRKMNIPVTFGATGAGIGSITTNSLYLLVINLASGATNCSINSRVRFVDA